MNKLIQLTINDLRNIIRDNFLKYFLLAVPILFLIIIIWILPLLIQEFPVLNNYTDIIIMFFALEFPMIIGFVISFLMLDEKDERVFTALRIMPVSLFQFLFYRLFFAIFFSFVFITIMLFFNNIYHLSIGMILLNSLLFALITPVVILIEVTFASNKVTGFTIFKGLNFILMIPVVEFFIHLKWGFLLKIIPSYWPMQSLFTTITQDNNFNISLISILYCFLVIFILSQFFKKRVYYI